MLANALHHLFNVVAQKSSDLLHIENFRPLASSVSVKSNQRRFKTQSIVGEVGEWSNKARKRIDLYK